MLENIYRDLLSKYTGDPGLMNACWSEITVNYSGPNRYYHNLLHLEEVLYRLSEVKSKIHNWDCLLFTLFYHDIIYYPKENDNEERSAQQAGIRMAQLGVPADIAERCKKQILATKDHKPSPDNDTAYFNDADLSILGQPWEVYSIYLKNIRKEYADLTDLLYKAGRSQVLKYFLDMDKIYTTGHFYKKYETQARLNIQTELGSL